MRLEETPTSSKQHVFDTLAYARRMESVGFSRQQAEALAEEQVKLIDERLATKADIETLRLSTKGDIEALRLSTKSDIEALRLATKADLTTGLAETKADLIKWVVGIGIAQTGFLFGVLKLHG